MYRMPPLTVKSWETAEWKRNREAFLIAHPYCEWHGAPVKATVPHHPQKAGTLSQAEYVSLKGCIPLCQACHFAAGKKLKLCPKCKEHYYKPRRGREHLCWYCFTQTPFGSAVKAYYDKFPEQRSHNKAG